MEFCTCTSMYIARAPQQTETSTLFGVAPGTVFQCRYDGLSSIICILLTIIDVLPTFGTTYVVSCDFRYFSMIEEPRH